jgi:hypothetical protein
VHFVKSVLWKKLTADRKLVHYAEARVRKYSSSLGQPDIFAYVTTAATKRIKNRCRISGKWRKKIAILSKAIVFFPYVYINMDLQIFTLNVLHGS